MYIIVVFTLFQIILRFYVYDLILRIIWSWYYNKYFPFLNMYTLLNIIIII